MYVWGLVHKLESRMLSNMSFSPLIAGLLAGERLVGVLDAESYVEGSFFSTTGRFVLAEKRGFVGLPYVLAVGGYPGYACILDRFRYDKGFILEGLGGVLEHVFSRRPHLVRGFFYSIVHGLECFDKFLVLRRLIVGHSGVLLEDPGVWDICPSILARVGCDLLYGFYEDALPVSLITSKNRCDEVNKKLDVVESVIGGFMGLFYHYE